MHTPPRKAWRAPSLRTFGSLAQHTRSAGLTFNAAADGGMLFTISLKTH
jgi:hypothetical protein